MTLHQTVEIRSVIRSKIGKVPVGESKKYNEFGKGIAIYLVDSKDAQKSL